MAMTDDQLEKKLDEILEALPIIRALGSVLVRQSLATESLGLNKNTIQKNDKIAKFEELGHRRTFIQIGEVDVIRRRNRGK